MGINQNHADNYWEELFKGDKSKFEELFQTYYVHLCIYAESILRDKAMAEDIVQIVFITLWTKREEIKINDSIKSYLYRMVYNNSINTIKAEQRKLLFVSKLYRKSEGSENWIDDFFNNENDLLIIEEIDRAVNGLPEQTRNVFMLSRIEGKKSAEIAEELNLSIRTVENHLYRALKRLKTELAHLESHAILLTLIGRL